MWQDIGMELNIYLIRFALFTSPRNCFYSKILETNWRFAWYFGKKDGEIDFTVWLRTRNTEEGGEDVGQSEIQNSIRHRIQEYAELYRTIKSHTTPM